jgi:tol-pal system protein YbgF
VTRSSVARRAVAGALLAAALAALPARAALFDDEEARKRIEATNQRITQVQRQLEDRIAAIESQLKSQGLVDLFNQVEQLKGDIARLRGQIEVLAHELGEAQKRQRDLYVDLDSRVRKLESAPAAASAPTGAAGAATGGETAAAPAATAAPPAAGAPPTATPAARPGATADAGAEQRAYDAALDQYKKGNYAAAVQGFSAFVKAYPKNALAPSAQYWIGNAQFDLGDYRAAIAAQRQLLASYPDSLKAPDAMLNIASSQQKLGDNAGARRTLEDLVARYPQSEAAAKAKQRLGKR